MYCTYCGQAFSRAEHLERHVITRKSGAHLLYPLIFYLRCWRLVATFRPYLDIVHLATLTPLRYQREAVQMCKVPFLLRAAVSRLFIE